MTGSIVKFAPYFLSCKKNKRFGFLVFSPIEKVPVFSKETARMFINRAIKEGIIRKEESLELLRQIENSKMAEEINVESCLAVLGRLEEVCEKDFSSSLYIPSLN
ncbi:MAG: hypothetical protein KAR00_00645 [Candidatus Pacebacteria bacterium]|nr:hypothetical protein [Candidatus Paceibacterota bacterium]